MSSNEQVRKSVGHALDHLVTLFCPCLSFYDKLSKQVVHLKELSPVLFRALSLLQKVVNLLLEFVDFAIIMQDNSHTNLN